ncbi:hypothetical protein [Arthrobacter sp. HY1533]|uniref:hypothetical protein n=1 Tax=Arthrobacter sp. HY1533 TaxID=2970919 RepID=UPI0022B9F5B4|nr:hypothetical protein [Arthrobacter sp. HY1533]
MTEQHTPSTQAATGPVAVSNAAVGPLTIRDLAVLGSVAIIFVASLVPMVVTLVGSLNLWNLASLFYIGIGVILPLSVGGLFLARRLSPEVKVRIGSLSIDQFASVVASIATFFFFTGTVSSFGVAYLVGLVGSLLLLASTVCARWIPSLASDFAGRAEIPAHVVARDAVPALKRPAAAKPVPAPGAPGALGVPAVPGAPNGAGVPAAQGAQAHWATPQANTSHTAAGQIFTPARENAPVVGTQGTAAALAAAAGVAAAGANSAPAASAAQQSATQAATAAGPAATASAPAEQQPAAAAGNIAATSAINTAPAASQTAPAPSAVNAGANASAAAVPAAVARPQEGAVAESMATTLNPQVAEPAPAPAPARESIAATVDPAPAVVAEPFWFAVDRPQNTIDEKTRQFAFKLMPGAWILALEDRGNSFLVQDSHGKTGLLLDLVGIERASDSQ